MSRQKYGLRELPAYLRHLARYLRHRFALGVFEGAKGGRVTPPPRPASPPPAAMVTMQEAADAMLAFHAVWAKSRDPFPEDFQGAVREQFVNLARKVLDRGWVYTDELEQLTTWAFQMPGPPGWPVTWGNPRTGEPTKIFGLEIELRPRVKHPDPKE